MTGSDVTVYAPVVEDAFDFSAEELAIVETTRRAQIVCIIPAYNEESVIRQCLIAAVYQSVPAHEIIVVDNMSRDRTAGIVRQMQLEYPESPIILLSQDRGLLRRRALPAGALILASDPDDQLADVLDRFDPPLAPWTRCPACNGALAAVAD